MAYSEEIKKIRQKCFLSQEAFGGELGASFSSINHWGGGKAIPNLNAMKNIKEFCLKKDVVYTGVEEAWIDFKVEGESK